LQGASRGNNTQRKESRLPALCLVVPGSDSDVKRLLRRAVLYELFDQIGQAPWYERVL